MSYTPSLRKQYLEHVVPELMKLRGYTNKHEVPRLQKITINTGIDAEADKNAIADVQRDVATLAGQKPGNCTMHEACDSYVVVEYNGDVYPCDFFVEKEWKIGNIMVDSWPEAGLRAEQIPLEQFAEMYRRLAG